MLTDYDIQPTPSPQVDDPYSAARVTSIISGIAALWLAGTPELYFGTFDTPSCLNELLCGGLILCLICARLLNPGRTAFASFTNAGIAAWIIISPWVLGFASTYPARAINDVWVGIAILLFSSFSGSITYRANKRLTVFG